MAYFGILHTNVRYALGVSTFTETDLAPLQWKADSASKPKIGLNINFPAAVFRSPLEFGGLETIPLHTIQGYKQIQLFIGSIRNQDEAGKLSMASLKFEQMESGYIAPIMNSRTSITYQKWATPTLVGSIQKFLHTMDTEIEIPTISYPKAQREFDVSLMETFQLKYTGTKILAQLNRCRVRLGVITLSDITTARGAKF